MKRKWIHNTYYILLSLESKPLEVNLTDVSLHVSNNQKSCGKDLLNHQRIHFSARIRIEQNTVYILEGEDDRRSTRMQKKTIDKCILSGFNKSPLAPFFPSRVTTHSPFCPICLIRYFTQPQRYLYSTSIIRILMWKKRSTNRTTTIKGGPTYLVIKIPFRNAIR